MNKICTKCKIEKDLENFYYKKTEKRFYAACKECVINKERQQNRDKKLKAVELMGGCCSKCGYNKNLAVLQFHHVIEREQDDTETMMKRTWDEIIKELKKCILLCANCHAIIHHPDTLIKKDSSLIDNKILNIDKFPKNKCLICNKPTNNKNYCSQKCSAISTRKIERPNKETLEKLLSEKSWSAIGREYNVSDNAIRKWAKLYNLI